MAKYHQQQQQQRYINALPSSKKCLSIDLSMQAYEATFVALYLRFYMKDNSMDNSYFANILF